MQRILLVLTLLFTFIPLSHAAAAPNIQVIQQNDTYNTVTKPFYHRYMGANDAFTVELRDKTVYKVYVSSYSSDFQTQGTERVVEPGAGRYLLRYNLTCNTSYVLKFYNSTGLEIYNAKLTVTGLENPTCDSAGDDEQEDVGGDGGIDCDICAALGDIKDSLNSGNSKLDDILNAIPPAPNWQHVANIMRDTIVPKLVADTKDMLNDLLGRAPNPPPTPPQPDAPEDIAMPEISEMPDAPNVELPPEEQDNNFTADDVIKDAPVINYEEPEEDEGFDLSVDPYKHLDDPGSPGTPKESEDPGSPGIPNQEVDAPPKPDTPNYDPGSPGTPNQDVGSPGTPNDNNLKPSNPGDDIGSPPGNYNPS